MNKRVDNMIKFKKEVLVARLMVVVMLIYFVLPLLPDEIFASTGTSKIEVIVDKSSVKTGEDISYTIKYSYSATSGTFQPDDIVATLPSPLTVKSVGTSSHVESYSESVVDGNEVVSFKIKTTAGATGVLTLLVNAPIGSIDEDKDVVISVAGGDGGNVSSPQTSIVLNDKDEHNWSVEKSLQAPYSDTVRPVPGSDITYKVKVKGNTGNGAYNLQNVTLVDYLPEEAVHLSNTGNGNYDVETHSVTWNVDTIKASDSFEAFVEVNYPATSVSAITVDLPETVTNKVNVVATSVTGSDNELTMSDQAEHILTFDIPNPAILNIEKKARGERADTEANAQEYSKEEEILYTITNIGNNGNVPLDSMTVYDVLPDGINLKSVSASEGTYYYSLEDTSIVDFDYKTIDDWTQFDTIDSISTTASAIKVEFGSLGIGLKHDDVEIKANYSDDFLAEAYDENDILTSIKTLDNIAYVHGYANDYDSNNGIYDTYNNVNGKAGNQDKAYIKLVDPLPIVSLSKGANKSAVYEEEIVTYTLTVSNARTATGSIENEDTITITDTLPSGVFDNLIITPDSRYVSDDNPVQLSSAIYNNDSLVNDYSTGDVDKIVFTITNAEIAKSKNYKIVYSVKVKDNTLVGYYPNTAVAVVDDVDDDHKKGPKTPSSLTATKKVFVKFKGSVDSVKGIGYSIFSDPGHDTLLITDSEGKQLVEDSNGKELKESDGEFEFVNGTLLTNGDVETSTNNEFALPINIPIVNATLPGGVVRYRLEVSNSEANGPLSNIVLIDKLPASGDTGVLDTDSRGSSWSPYLINGISVNGYLPGDDDYAGEQVTVYYSTEASPSYTQLNNAYANADDPNPDSYHVGWTTTLPENITEVTHIKIVVDKVLNPSDSSLVLEWDMRAPYDAPATVEGTTNTAIAWNSFAYGATYTVVDGNDTKQEPFLPAEPIKVGTRIEPNISPLQAAIGDFIWFDADKDGLQSSETIDDVKVEPGINDIPVRLYYSANADFTASKLLDETVTGPNNGGEAGYYYFPNLGAGFYKVEFDMPSDFYITDKDANSNGSDAIDSDFEKLNDQEESRIYTTDIINLTAGETANIDTTIDAGIYRKTSVGDFVWIDTNANGVQDSGEVGIENVKVNLYRSDVDRNDDVALSTTYTDVNGYYSFIDLDPGDYYIDIDLDPNNSDDANKNADLVNYTISPQNQKANDGVSVDVAILSDSNINVDTSQSETFTLAATIAEDEDGDYIDTVPGYLTNPTIDGGIHKAIIGNYVWNDLDRDGIQDSNEPGIEGVTVTLTDELGNIITDVASVTTNSSGEYIFRNLDDGTYKVKFTLPNGSVYRPTKTGETLNDPANLLDTNDSDGIITEGQTQVFVTDNIDISVGEIDLTNDMGFYRPGKIGNYVWEDMNGNGIQDNYNDGTGSKVEPSVEGLTVSIYDENAIVIYNNDDHLVPYKQLANSMLTPASGIYEFDDLLLGTYKIKVDLSGEYVGFITPNGGHDTKDSDIIIDTGYSHLTTLSKDKYEDMTLDAGVYRYASIGDTVWYDNNINGIQDETDANENPIVNGVQGVKVSLYKGASASGTPFLTDETDANGAYLFENLVPGIYSLKFEDYNLKDGKYYSVTSRNIGSDDDKDSDGLVYAIQDDYATINNFQLLSNEDNMSYDLGIYESFELGNYVWNDLDGNGIQDANEPGLEGVELELYKYNSPTSSDLVEDDIQTDSNGAYLFEDLPIGKYYVKVVDNSDYDIDEDFKITLLDQVLDPDLNSDLKDNDADPRDNETGLYTFEASSPKSETSVDIGIYEYSKLGNYVWEDLSRDGLQDSSQGMNGVTVNLYKEVNDSYELQTSKVTTTLDDKDGSYLFDKLAPGTYRLVFEIPENYTATKPDSGLADDATDSDGYTDTSSLTYIAADTINTINDIPVISGTDNMTLDFGMYKSFSIGDYVWLDDDGDGKQETGEDPLSGITLKLYSFTGGNQVMSNDTLVRTLDSNGDLTDSVATSVLGKYIFSDLPMGKYFVVLEKEGYRMTLQDQGSDKALDSNFKYNPITIGGHQFITSADDPYEFTSTTSVDNRSIITVDAGLFELAGLGDRVWLDENYNGIQDNGEPGIEGIPVRLYKDGIELKPNGSDYETNSNGEYFFDDLDPGSYKIEFDMPLTYFLTEADQTPSDSDLVAIKDQIDSDGELKTPNGQTVVINNIELGSNKHIDTYDIGLYQKASISDFVWVDENRNGIQDENGPTISNAVRENIIVNLYYKDSSSVYKDTTTNEFGYYIFDNLYPDTYDLEFILPNGDIKYSLTDLDTLNNKADDVDSDASPDDIQDTKGSVSDITLSSGEKNVSIDMGFYESFSLGDTIWEDKNVDGVQNDGENVGLGGVNVHLFISGVDGSDLSKAVDSTTTDLNGNYSFTDLPKGSYFVRVDKPSGYYFTGQNSGESSNDDSVDSDFGLVESTNYGFSDPIVFLKGSANHDPKIDAGLYTNAGFGDTVWEDTNRDGIQNEGSNSGIPGVKVYLYEKDADHTVENSELAIEETNALGYYFFGDLKPGDYYVVFRDLPDNYSVTKKGDNSSLDSDGIPLSILDEEAIIEGITVESNEKNYTYDLGLYKSFSIGDYAWFDTNGNGAQDINEKPVKDLVLKLYKIDDNKEQDVSKDTYLGQTMTDENGYYEFNDLPKGNYYVQLAPSDLYYVTLMNDENTLEEEDSDFDQLSGISDIHTFNDGTAIGDEFYDDLDIGVFTLAGLGDYVWIDKNYDGIQDNEGEGLETGLNGVLVRLLKDGVEVKTTYTNDSGYYSFTQIDPGNYSILFDLPDETYITKYKQGSNEELDSNGLEVSNKRQAEITGIKLEAEELITGLDLGLYEYASISNLVFEDIDRDGIQDEGEPGIPGVTVTLKWGDNTETIVTDEKGEYIFEELLPGDYTVVFSGFENGYSLTKSNYGDDTLDSDGVSTEFFETQASVENITLVSGQDNKDIDLGLYKNFSLGDFIWIDKDGDGYQDGDEVGLKDVTLKLYTSATETQASKLIKTTISNSVGQYLFDDLPMGSYFVTAVFDDEYIVTLHNQITDLVDSDFDRVDYKTGNYQFTTSTPYNERHDSSVDLGLFTVAGLGDRVWIDKNYDGVQDSDEVGKEGLLVELLQNDSVVDSTYTNENGYYFFEDKEPGVYSIQMTMPDDFYLTYQFVGEDIEKDSNGQFLTEANEIVVISDYQLYVNETITSLDIGIYQLGSIGNYVWIDANQDGIQDLDEQPVVGMTVELSGEGITKKTETDKEGKYIFEDLIPGEYLVRFDRYTNYKSSPTNSGSDGSVDSDTNSGGVVSDIILSSGEDIDYIDAGMYYSEPTVVETEIPVVTPTPEVIPSPTPVVTPDPEVTATPEPTLAPTPTPEAAEPPDIKELKPETPTVDLPEEDKPKERIFVVDEEVDEVSVVKEPDHGTVVVDDGNNIIYTPGDTFDGSDSIVVLIEDGDDDFLMEIDIFEEDIAEAQLAELPATSGIPTKMYYLIGSLLAMTGVVFKKKF